MTACARALSSYLVRSLPTGPFVGARLGSSDACYRKGVWEPTGQRTEDGGGAKKMRETFWSPTIGMLMSSPVGLVLGWQQDRAGPPVSGRDWSRSSFLLEDE